MLPCNIVCRSQEGLFKARMLNNTAQSVWHLECFDKSFKVLEFDKVCSHINSSTKQDF